MDRRVRECVVCYLLRGNEADSPNCSRGKFMSLKKPLKGVAGGNENGSLPPVYLRPRRLIYSVFRFNLEAQNEEALATILSIASFFLTVI